MTDRNKAIPASYLILEQDGKILLMRRFQTGYMDGNYSLPAGHVDPGELPIETMIREAKEEIGLDIVANDIEFVHVAYELPHDETGNRVDFYFKTTNWSGEPVIVEPHKCDALLWASVDDLPENMIPKVRKALEAYRDKILYGQL